MEKFYTSLVQQTIKKSYSYPDIKNHNTCNLTEFKNTRLFERLVKRLFEILDKHDQISPAKIKSLENHGIINFIGHTLDKFQALIKDDASNSKDDASNSDVILKYETLTEMLLHLIYICKMQYGVNISLNKERNINYIYLSFYNNHLQKPSPDNKGYKNLGRLDNYNNKQDPEIYLKAENEFFELTTAGFLDKFFPETRNAIKTTRAVKAVRKNIFEPKHKPKPKGYKLLFEPKHKPKPKG